MSEWVSDTGPLLHEGRNAQQRGIRLHIACFLMTQCSVWWPVMAPPSIGPGLLGLMTELTVQASRSKGNQHSEVWFGITSLAGDN